MPEQYYPDPITRNTGRPSRIRWDAQTKMTLIGLILGVLGGTFVWVYPNLSLFLSSLQTKPPYISSIPPAAQKTATSLPTQTELPPTPTSPPIQTTDQLYHANWSIDADQWSIAPYWHWSNEDGGVLTTAPTVANNAIFAPYTLTSKTYKVEATIKLLGFSSNSGAGRAYGIIVKKALQNGYVCGVGIHTLPEHFFLGELAVFSAYPPYRIPSDLDPKLDKQPVTINNGDWHTYRVEVTDSNMTFFLDGIQIDQVGISSPPATEQVGIYVDNAAIQIKSFDILG